MMVKGNRIWIAVGLGIILLAVGTVWTVHSRYRVSHKKNSKGLEMAGLSLSEEDSANLDSVPVLEVPLDAAYFNADPKQSLLISVEAVPIQCGEGRCGRFEKTARLVAPKSGRIMSSIPLSVSEISDAIKSKEGNWLLDVSVCEDSHKRGTCDGSPLIQALRMKGSFLTSADYRGSFQVDIVSQ
jgi:hypothetical protein